MLNYIPILTTLFSAFFFFKIYKHYEIIRKKHSASGGWSVCWRLASGTLTESLNAHWLAGMLLTLKYGTLWEPCWAVFMGTRNNLPAHEEKDSRHSHNNFCNCDCCSLRLCYTYTRRNYRLPLINQLTGKVFVWEWVACFPVYQYLLLLFFPCRRGLLFCL